MRRLAILSLALVALIPVGADAKWVPEPSAVIKHVRFALVGYPASAVKQGRVQGYPVPLTDREHVSEFGRKIKKPVQPPPEYGTTSDPYGPYEPCDEGAPPGDSCHQWTAWARWYMGWGPDSKYSDGGDPEFEWRVWWWTNAANTRVTYIHVSCSNWPSSGWTMQPCSKNEYASGGSTASWRADWWATFDGCPYTIGRNDHDWIVANATAKPSIEGNWYHEDKPKYC